VVPRRPPRGAFRWGLTTEARKRRRGRPVKSPASCPAELAYQLARKLQARRLGTVSVL
jgi:hypothetical protein